MHEVERSIKFLTHPLVMIGCLALIIASYTLFDRPLALQIHALDLSNRYPILIWITQLGRSSLWLVIIPIVALYYRYVHRVKQTELRIWFLWGTLFITTGICTVLKNLLGRARPELLFTQDLFGFYGFQLDGMYHSFPSGHTTLATTAVISLALLFPRYRWSIFAVGVLVLATRILLTWHYLSDVLATLYMVVLEYRILLYIVTQQCPLYWKRLSVK